MKNAFLTAIFLWVAQSAAIAQTEAWKQDARTLFGSIRSVALKNNYRKLVGWNYTQAGSFYADTSKAYAIVYVYENTSCPVPKLTVKRMAKADEPQQQLEATTNAMVYQSANGMYLLLDPPKKNKTPFKIETSCHGAVYVLVRNAR